MKTLIRYRRFANGGTSESTGQPSPTKKTINSVRFVGMVMTVVTVLASPGFASPTITNSGALL